MDNPITLNFKKATDKTQCPINRTLSTLEGRSLCPWIYENKIIRDRFPHRRSSVKCTCDSCKKFPTGYLLDYSCFAVSQRVPILKKVKCGTKKIFEWKETYDEVNVACICGLANVYIQH